VKGISLTGPNRNTRAYPTPLYGDVGATARIVVYADKGYGFQIAVDGKWIEGNEWSQESLKGHCAALYNWMKPLD
jgi:hypothetical protein